MFTSVPSLDAVTQCLAPVFSQPNFQNQGAILRGWIMCLSYRSAAGSWRNSETSRLPSSQLRLKETTWTAS